MDRPLESLNRLMKARRSGAAPVALTGERAYTWKDFQAHVSGACSQLADQPSGRWLLCGQSAYTFGVGLFALWQTGRVAVLPANQQPESLAEVSKGVRGILSESSPQGNRLPWISPLAVTSDRHDWKELKITRACLELFTSGSTGERKAVTKTLAQLQNEIAVLEKTFGSLLGSCQVYSTVPPQHIYGLLFRLLWPLCAGRPFADDTLLLWEELGPRLAQASAASLVSSPAHLERISPAGKNALHRAGLRAIFSSGGPLQQSAVNEIREHAGKAPVEVFGSTETGGVGWRQRKSLTGSEDWTPLSKVTVSQVGSQPSGRLRVRSPFVSSSTHTFLMGDRGRVFKDQTFRLEGRIDRVVKIAEKRLSLDDMERRLQQHAWVAESKILVLASSNGTLRQSLGAAIVLNEQGRSHLRDVGRAGLATAFRAHLQKSFDASTVPRSFRFMESLPQNAQGKLAHSELAALFQSRFDPSVTTPQRLQTTKKKSSLHLRLRVPEDLAYLEGHFPEHAIVPGIVQLRWVVEAATQWLGKRISIRRMEAVKFKTVLLPGRLFSLVVERDTSGAQESLRFSLTEKQIQYSSGRLVLS
jgi:acyl-coenzyme A synthetase/AMP-(fatty) acid ligase